MFLKSVNKFIIFFLNSLRFTALVFLLTIQTSCKSYNDRIHFKEDYLDAPNEYTYSDIRYYNIAGENQKVQKTDYDYNNIIRKETFYRNKTPYRIRLYNEFC